MKPKFQLILLFCVIGFTANAQNDTSARFNIGDAAPSLRVGEWIKGKPINNFEKGKIYVVEFWATWCRPCIAAMPHLSRLARKYKHKATFLAIDVYESRAYKPAPMTKVKAFVAGMGRRMDFPIAEEDTNYTARDWLKAFRWDGVPTTFIVDGQERVAWVGDPSNVDTVLRKVLNNTWDVKKALAQRIHDDNWRKSDLAVVDKVRHYQDNYDHLEDLGKQDSILLVINELVEKEPDLKYAPYTVSYTFYALLINNPHKAYEYGKEVMITSTYDDPAWDMIIGDIKSCSRKINIPPDIYRLGADCYQAKINHLIYPQLHDRAKLYRNMAEWYRLAGEKAKAIKAEKKSIRLYRRNK